jgi:hypothetical protein
MLRTVKTLQACQADIADRLPSATRFQWCGRVGKKS